MANLGETLAKVANTIQGFQSALTSVEEENKSLTVAKASSIFKSLIPQLKELGNMVELFQKLSRKSAITHARTRKRLSA